MIVSFVRSPFFSNWFEHHQPSKSVLICSPFLKNEALERIIDQYDLYENAQTIEIKVLLRGSLRDFIQGSSDISALESLIRIPKLDIDNVRRLLNLHMKAYLIDEQSLLVGSGNCTNSGLFCSERSGNVESAIATNNKRIIRDFISYFREISLSSESLDSFYDEVIEKYPLYLEKFPPMIEPNEISDIKFKESKARYHFKSKKTTKPEKQKKLQRVISPETIPQFSNFEHGAYKIVEILSIEGDYGLTFNQLGEILEGRGKKQGAYKKYGENHAKLAELLDFAVITHSRPRKVYLTKLGKLFYTSTIEKQNRLIKSQILRMDIVKDILVKYMEKRFDFRSYLGQYLSATTVRRRMPNVKHLFKVLKELGIDEAKPVLRKLS